MSKIMSNSTGKLVEGVFAINKPPAISSAQVIRNLQGHLNPSALFAPWIANERALRNEESNHQRNRRKNKRVQVKIGHGGTLDPMATGVLIMGVGKGTKQLQTFLECTKTYVATVLFGAETDTYDVLGKVLKKAEYAHLTRSKVEDALEGFRGKIMQRPPLYSALRMNGKRLYEYAREGKEIPKEIEKRSVEVKELEILEWLDGGEHNHQWPQEEAEDEAKELAQKVHESIASSEDHNDIQATNGIKRKRSSEQDEDDSVSIKKPILADETDTRTLMSGAIQSPGQTPPKIEPISPPAEGTKAQNVHASPALNPGPPAVKLRMTVTSGFYVRSLSHDLGQAVGSLACMSELVRTRQGSFELGENVLEYEELAKGEDTWAPQLENLLSKWDEKGEDSSDLAGHHNPR